MRLGHRRSLSEKSGAHAFADNFPIVNFAALNLILRAVERVEGFVIQRERISVLQSLQRGVNGLIRRIVRAGPQRLLKQPLSSRTERDIHSRFSTEYHG